MERSEEPRIDILMATYNGERYLREQIDSIMGQTYSNWRLLISDDCSTDNTVSIIKEYEARDSRIKLVSAGRRYGGPKENFLNLLAHATSEYAMFSDQDDVWLPNKISLTHDKMYQLERENPDTPCLVFTDLQIVDSDLRVIGDSYARSTGIYPIRVSLNCFVRHSTAAGCTMMMNRFLVEMVRATSDFAPVYMHDRWVMLVALCTGRAEYVDSPTMRYRIHGGNTLGLGKGKQKGRGIAERLIEYAQRVESTRNEARLLLEDYSPTMTKQDINILESYIESSCGGIRGLLYLIKSKCWARAPRERLIQIAVLFYPGKRQS